ncbi:MAG TPA: hypothetical protein VFM10_01640 [Terriglobales bacterium]|nr:hypothetical protein [Terriglobales bacterium]
MESTARALLDFAIQHYDKHKSQYSEGYLHAVCDCLRDLGLMDDKTYAELKGIKMPG